MGRFLGISATLSAVLCVALIPVLPLSYHLKQDSFKPGATIAPRFHVGVLNGAVCIYSDMAFSGGTTGISRDDGSVDPVRERVLSFPGGHYVAFFSSSTTVWSLNVTLLWPIIVSAVVPLIWLYRFRYRRSPNQPGPSFGSARTES